MSKRITAAALVALMLLVVLPAKAAIQATSVEIRGAIAEPSTDPSFTPGMLATENATWNPYNFAGFYYDLKNNLGNENLAVVAPGTDSCPTPGPSVSSDGRTIKKDCLEYTTGAQAKVLYAVLNGKATEGNTNGLQNFGAGEMSSEFGAYNIEGWQAQPYVGIKNTADHLAKLVIEQQNATSEKTTLTVGQTWDVGGGWQLTANSIDAKASPRQVWITLSKDGVKMDDAVVQQGSMYTYVAKNIGGESDVPLFVTYVDSIFSGATSDVVQLRYTWAIDTSITKLNGGDTYGVFTVERTSPNVMLNNDNSDVTLSRDTTVNLMGEMNFRTADSDVARFYPMVQYQISPTNITPTPTSTVTATVTGTATGTATETVTGTATYTGTATGTATATPTPKVPGFEAVFAIAGLLAVAYLVLRQRK